MEGNKLISVQESLDEDEVDERGQRSKVKVTREFLPDRMNITYESGEVVANAVYERCEESELLHHI